MKNHDERKNIRCCCTGGALVLCAWMYCSDLLVYDVVIKDFGGRRGAHNIVVRITSKHHELAPQLIIS